MQIGMTSHGQARHVSVPFWVDPNLISILADDRDTERRRPVKDLRQFPEHRARQILTADRPAKDKWMWRVKVACIVEWNGRLSKEKGGEFVQTEIQGVGGREGLEKAMDTHAANLNP